MAVRHQVPACGVGAVLQAGRLAESVVRGRGVGQHRVRVRRRGSRRGDRGGGDRRAVAVSVDPGHPHRVGGAAGQPGHQGRRRASCHHQRVPGDPRLERGHHVVVRCRRRSRPRHPCGVRLSRRGQSGHRLGPGMTGRREVLGDAYGAQRHREDRHLVDIAVERASPVMGRPDPEALTGGHDGVQLLREGPRSQQQPVEVDRGGGAVVGDHDVVPLTVCQRPGQWHRHVVGVPADHDAGAVQTDVERPVRAAAPPPGEPTQVTVRRLHPTFEATSGVEGRKRTVARRTGATPGVAVHRRVRVTDHSARHAERRGCAVGQRRTGRGRVGTRAQPGRLTQAVVRGGPIDQHRRRIGARRSRGGGDRGHHRRSPAVGVHRHDLHGVRGAAGQTGQGAGGRVARHRDRVLRQAPAAP